MILALEGDDDDLKYEKDLVWFGAIECYIKETPHANIPGLFGTGQDIDFQIGVDNLPWDKMLDFENIKH